MKLKRDSNEMEDFGPTDSGGNLPYTINQGLNRLDDAKIGIPKFW